MKVSLAKLEKIRRGSQHKMSQDKLECDILKAILLSDEGRSRNDIPNIKKT